MKSGKQAAPSGRAPPEYEVLLMEAIAALSAAKDDEDRRRAIILWVRGAAIAVDELTDAISWEGSPADLLLAALDGLEHGISSPLLRPTPGGTRDRAYLARAKARAVAAVEILRERGSARPGKAIEAISVATGLKEGTLRSLRSHVLAGTGYREVQQYLAEERASLEDTFRQSRLLSVIDPVKIDEYFIFTVTLTRDRAILSQE